MSKIFKDTINNSQDSECSKGMIRNRKPEKTLIYVMCTIFDIDGFFWGFFYYKTLRRTLTIGEHEPH